MKNTLENKLKFFGQYYYQNVCMNKHYYDNNCGAFGVVPYITDIPEQWLELKPLSSISDEDALNIVRFLGFNWDEFKSQEAKAFIIGVFVLCGADNIKYKFILKQMLFQAEEILIIIDKFRELGYAYNWNGITVEEQIEFGWVKLKQ